ncbi:TetR/AcrR family transcriptional regulator [Aquamicrobium sp. LC103]|uniref:TetR/AcrR family transcriptional regulator n=1 Tax=Aquamicrobium sp. LC103 TaxID=1120658 RepID=UPI00063E6D98|nr:TetR/AcrR family transcriptional regulator [Aquamicrobium sp. LC103]TKT69657.1 TetR/AcrR family transcriptional regulator [Aquamicrobium sp. LC103]
MNGSPAVAARQTRRFGEKRTLILEAAARLFNQHGVRGTTLTDVGAEVGLLTNSISYYFRKKEDLAAACFLRTIETIIRTATVAADQEITARARLRRFLTLYVQLHAEIATGSRAELLSSNDLRALEEPHASAVFASYVDMFRSIRQLLLANDMPEVERTDLIARTHLIVSVVHSVQNWIRRYDLADYPRVAARLADILTDGMGEGARDFSPPELLSFQKHVSSEGDSSRERFLQAATFLINEHGYRGASVEKISARLSVTKGSFYHHNEDKDELVADCFERTFSLIHDAQSAAIDTVPDGWSRACGAVSALTRFQFSPRGPLLRIAALSAMPEPMRPKWVARMNQLMERFAGIVSDGIADGSMRPIDARIAGQLLYTTSNSAAELHRWISTEDADAAMKSYVRPLFTGLLHP